MTVKKTVGAGKADKVTDPRGEIDPTTGIEVSVIKTGGTPVLPESTTLKPVTFVTPNESKDG